MTADTIGPYRLLSLIGRGNLGEVWRARDTRSDREVALKLLDGHLAGDVGHARRFRREVAATAGITFPHLVSIHDFGELDGRLFVAMSLVEGTNLAALLKRLGPLPAERAVGIVTQVAEALDHVHRAGAVHRDVKPSNILVGQGESGADLAYLLDLGIAHALDDTGVSLSGAVILSPAYLAPERFDGDGDRLADVYGLACVLYEALTGDAALLGEWTLGAAERPPSHPAAPSDRCEP